MKKQKVRTDFSRYTDSDLVSFNDAIQEAIPGSGFFPTPSPALTVVAAATADFQAAMAAAAVGGTAQTDFKNQARDVLIDLFQQLGAYVQLVSAGDVGKMKASAYPTSKIPTPVGPLGKPENFNLSPAKKGQLFMSVKRPYGAKNFLFEYKLVDAEVWITVSTTKSKIVISGLQSGKEYMCRVLPCGTSDERTYSDVISCFVN
jgi:hypothetical protein